MFNKVWTIWNFIQTLNYVEYICLCENDPSTLPIITVSVENDPKSCVKEKNRTLDGSLIPSTGK